ncbi:aminodeoxychorismate/anthranilate synthase component II [Pseudobacteriovorax antillogorgiicola]|uniref:Anthranilate synthase component 2 n=1 Tax=Pseudobacteriovorax antillogorgiicola TaxID=1513793 RepID=A0A1Y6B4M9_9BACT|nr:aminodeoxychorismate/anthranilate synthase component II [Pseudobacteriovorax antillogorgiicola]TCS59557.1 anthranilate synthase component 2 [Pseudobacteriovorax antillogorgiicola]SME87726.1 anthranilate synthase component 2 [Pseudobacteriovorax antillogorgiicola]
MEVLFIDHYDSFSFNLLDWLQRGSHKLDLIRVPFDRMNEFDLSQRKPLVLSPGPKSPRDVLQSLSLTADMMGKAPILGVCLGHQILGAVLGSRTIQAKSPFHGSRRDVHVSKGSQLFPLGGLLSVATYNSLVLDQSMLKEHWITGVNDWGEVEILEYWDDDYPAVGVQFHPESFLSEGMEPLLQFWLRQCQQFYSGKS